MPHHLNSLPPLWLFWTCLPRQLCFRFVLLVLAPNQLINSVFAINQWAVSFFWFVLLVLASKQQVNSVFCCIGIQPVVQPCFRFIACVGIQSLAEQKGENCHRLAATLLALDTNVCGQPESPLEIRQMYEQFIGCTNIKHENLPRLCTRIYQQEPTSQLHPSAPLVYTVSNTPTTSATMSVAIGCPGGIFRKFAYDFCIIRGLQPLKLISLAVVHTFPFSLTRTSRKCKAVDIAIALRSAHHPTTEGCTPRKHM